MRHGDARRGQQLRVAHQQVGHQHRQEAGRVEEEAGRDADQPDDQAGDRRSHDAGQVEGRAVERDRVGDVGATDHLDHERLPDGHLDGVHEAQPDGQQVDHPDLHQVGHHQDAQRQGEDERHDLGHDERLTLGQGVGDDAAEEAEDEHRQELAGGHDAQRERVVGQRQHQPALGDRLHPGADQRDQLAGEEEPEVAVCERRSDAARHARPSRRGRDAQVPGGGLDDLDRASQAQATRVERQVVVPSVHPVDVEPAAKIGRPGGVDRPTQVAQGGLVGPGVGRQVLDPRRQVADPIGERGMQLDAQHVGPAGQDEAGAATEDDHAATGRGLLDDRLGEGEQPLTDGRRDGRLEGGRGHRHFRSAGREGRRDALPEARHPLVVALGVRLRDACALGRRGHDLAVQEGHAEAPRKGPPDGRPAGAELARERDDGHGSRDRCDPLA